MGIVVDVAKVLASTVSGHVKAEQEMTHVYPLGSSAHSDQRVEHDLRTMLAPTCLAQYEQALP